MLRLLQRRGISIRVATKHLAAEEAPESYKVGGEVGKVGGKRVEWVGETSNWLRMRRNPTQVGWRAPALRC